MIRTASLIALPFLLLACSSEPTEDVTTVDLEGGEAPNTNPLIERFDDVVIVVNADGLGVHQQAPLRFGSPRSEVDGAVEAAFGSAGITSRNEECGAGPMTFATFDQFVANFQDDRFVGWMVNGPSERASFTGPDGVALGMSAADLRKLSTYAAFEDSTLGEEFTVGGNEMLVSGLIEDNQVAVLWGGVACNFR